MWDRTMVAGCILACVVLAAPAARAQLPGGVQIPGLSQDALLKQAKDLVSQLTAMKGSGKLGTDQLKQVDDLLPKAASLQGELEKPQVDTGSLPKLASTLSDLQKQVGTLQGSMK